MKELIKPEHETLIYSIGGRQVMLDADLALLYDVQTKALKQQVKRNVERFPEDFMFELTKTEVLNLRSQTVASRLSKEGWGGLHYIHDALPNNPLAIY